MAPEAVFKTMNFFGKLITFLKEVKLETKKVNWPTRKQTVNYTLIVLAISAVVAVFLGGWDFVFTLILEKFIL
jgi:preprotein translocase subunit SecE